MTLTKVLVAINIVVYIWEALSIGNAGVGALMGDLFASPLVAKGALYGPAVAAGQWYRIVSAAFLHANLTHILFNMLALWQVGSVVEVLYGRVRMAFVYALAVAGSGWAVVQFSYLAPTVGASGAIFGLFGAMLAAGLRLGARGRALVQQTLPIIVINLLLGFFIIPNVSNAGHIGGLVSGFVAGLVFFNVMPPRHEQARAAAAATEAGVEAEVVQSPPAPPVAP